MKTFKYLIGQIHLWIGLIVGALFFVIAFSGAILTWGPELRSIIFKQSIESQDAPFVLPSDLKATIDQQFPDLDYRTAFFREKDKTCEVLLYGRGTYLIAQLNPYTAELVHLQDMNKGFLSVVLGLHRNLMLKDFGRQVVHWVTLMFFILMITGLILWWPENKQSRKGRLTIKWGASPKKINYDLHNVLGFYATWISIFTVITGLFWGFEVIRDGLQWVTNEDEIVYEEPLSDDQDFNKSIDQFVLMDSLTLAFKDSYPDKTIRISNPHEKSEPISVLVNDFGLLNMAPLYFYFDRYTGKEIKGHFMHGPGDRVSTYEKLHGMVYEIHFGTIGGFPLRLLVFFATLIASSLPITGFIYWLGRQRKKR